MAGTERSSPRPSSFGAVAEVVRRMTARETAARGSLITGAALELGGTALGIAGPYALKELVDDLAVGTSPAMVVAWVLIFIGAWVAGAIMANWRMVYSTRAIDRVAARLVEAMALDRLPAAATGRAGDSAKALGLIERLPYSLSIVVDGLIWRTGPLCLQFLITLVIVGATIPLQYAALLALTVSGYAVVAWLSAAAFQLRAADLNAASGAVSALTGDIFRNARRVVLNGALNAEVALVGAALSGKAAANRRMMWTLVRSSLAQYGVLSAGLLTLLILSGLDARDHRITVGAFILLQTYAFRLILPVSGLGYILSQSATALANIKDVLAAIGNAAPCTASEISVDRPAAITLREIDFSYGPDLPGVTGVTLDIPRGSFAVIVGANGSGKSTLAQLIAGLLSPSAGTVRVGGVDIGEVPAADRYKLVLYVPQFVGLFNRSIAENALYPPTHHSEVELRQLLEAWQFHEPGRAVDLAAMVGEQGERLSGGQIQKLELARVIGIDAPVIILDESTSALDPSAEEDVIATLRRRFAGKTTLVMITHRQGVVAKADQVLFMRASALYRQGAHAQLLADSAAYSGLWNDRPE